MVGPHEKPIDEIRSAAAHEQMHEDRVFVKLRNSLDQFREFDLLDSEPEPPYIWPQIEACRSTPDAAERQVRLESTFFAFESQGYESGVEVRG